MSWTVVEARVEEPFVKKLPAASVPAMVVDPAESAVKAASCPVMSWTVVLARVVEPTTASVFVATREPVIAEPLRVVLASEALVVPTSVPTVAEPTVPCPMVAFDDVRV